MAHGESRHPSEAPGKMQWNYHGTGRPQQRAPQSYTGPPLAAEMSNSGERKQERTSGL